MSAISTHAYYYSAVCFRHLGEYERAIEYYQETLDNWPDYQYAWSAQLLIGDCLESLRDSGSLPESEANAQIEQAYKAVVENYPDCSLVGHACLKLAGLNSRKEQWPETAWYYELFLEMADPNDPRTKRIKARLGQLQGAEK